MVGDLIYACNEEGQTFIFQANAETLQVVSSNSLGTSVFSTPVICGNRIYNRVAIDKDGKRQEMLYCIGE